MVFFSLLKKKKEKELNRIFLLFTKIKQTFQPCHLEVPVSQIARVIADI